MMGACGIIIATNIVLAILPAITDPGTYHDSAPQMERVVGFVFILGFLAIVYWILKGLKAVSKKDRITRIQ